MMEIKIDNSKSVNKTDLENKIKAMYKKVAEKPNDTYHFEMGRALGERLGYNPYTRRRFNRKRAARNFSQRCLARTNSIH